MDPNPHPKKSTDHSAPHHKPSQPSPAALLSSAKIVADAAQSTLRHESDKIDKAKVADAAADILNAASRYGKLEEKSFGKYVEKAEGYLHQYHSTGTTHSAHAGSSSSSSSSTSSASHHSGGGGSGGGIGDYMKLAEGLLKKEKPNAHQSGGANASETGKGDYLKMAQGFLKKH